ncbi:SusC/RagA family TonB-linked outer membrane protein [Chondrinema litorale]|uniref:SusC/RagA family TonB-linked outer membrane protein n=1 Tax=Chondrinema litorale TaxID=2994555 RepID=UPI0025435940|nr:TonB-dependent receptor [Chondrinema litorale]UZR94554.1 TonB-dependent receptor [Chondrinema litorale]
MKYFYLQAIFMVLGLSMGFSQDRTISGTIISSADDSPLPGVNVVVKGTAIGTISDIDGNFKLAVPQEYNTLIFTYIGFETLENEIGAQTTFDISLKEDISELEEVMVMGYTSKRKNELTGSTVQVGGDELKDVPVTSVDQALQGKVPGLNISASSGTPGSAQDIRIRGVGTITAGNAPLIVIDGVPMINNDFSGSTATSSLSALSSINSNDIESITVLKDASATSAYGARGSNGVIVITTKKGNSGKTKFSASASYGFQNNAVDGLTPLNGDQRAELLLNAIYNTFGDSEGFTQDGAYDFMVENNVDGGSLQNWNGEDGNWADAVTNKDAVVQNYDVAASGGDGISSFYASIGYNKTEATVIGSDFERFTAKLNYNRNLTEKLVFTTNTTIANTIQNGFLEQSSYFANPHLTKYFMSPWEQPYNEDGSINTNLGTSVYNTVYTQQNTFNKSNLTRLLNNSSLEFEIIENLKFKTLFSADFNLASLHSFEDDVHGGGVDVGGDASQNDRRNFNYVAQNSLDYSYSVNGHNFGVLALMEYQKNKFYSVYSYGENFPAAGLTYVSSASANYDASSDFEDWSNSSYLGMVNYNYQGKYVADFTYRYEGSSKFAEGLRYGGFWSVGAAWNISEETFLSNANFVNSLKLRASYGLSGNSNIDINKYQALLQYDANYNDEGAVYPGQFGNTNLTWEKNKTLDLGIDYSLFKDRISGSLAYYYKETFDLLQDVPLSRTTGHEEITQNVGTMVNKGIEALISFDIIRQNDFNFRVSANVATVENEVTELAKSSSGEDITITSGSRKVEVGQPVYAWYMRKWAGVNPDNGSAQWYVNDESDEVTESYYDAEQVYVGGSAIPKFTGGLNTHLDFKGVYLDVNLYFAGGHKVYEDWSFYTRHSGYYTTLYYNGVEAMMDRWQQPGDITDVPKVVFGTNDDSRTSDRFLYDGDYMRVKDIVIGYKLPASLIAPLKIESLSIYARGTNLFTWVKDDRLEYDPEVRADGFTRLTTPPVKSIIFGLNLNF